MIRWDATTLIPIFASLTYGVVLVGVVFSKPRTKTRQVFSIYLLAMFIWSVSAFLTLSELTGVQPWFNIFSAAAITSNLAIFFFVQTLFSRRRSWAPYIFWYGMIAVIITLVPDLVFHSVAMDQNGGLHYEFAPLIVVVAGPGYFLMFFSLIELIRGARATTHEAERNRLRYLIVGLSIIVFASMINFTDLGKYPIDIAANGVTAIIIAYAILRHQLLDIRVVLRIGLLYSIMTTVLGTFYYLVISVLLNLSYYVLEGSTYSSGDVILISVAVAGLTGLILTPVRNQAQTWIDRIFYREKYNASLMLQRLSQTTATVLDLTKITDLILSEVVKTFHIEHGAIYVKLYHYDDFRVVARHGSNHAGNPRFLIDHPIIRWLSNNNQVLTKDNLGINPMFKSLWGLEREDLEAVGSELFIPLHAKGKLVGFLTVGPKLSEQPYSLDERVILSTLANQTAVAVENAILYEELEDTFEQTVISLANAIDIRDAYTSDHSQHIAQLAASTAEELGCSTEIIGDVYWGGLLHDIGKIGVPDEILNSPDGLSDKDWTIIYQHTIIGSKIISPIKKLARVAPIIEHSHENFDGSGYPHGADQGDIPLGARIIRVVDSFSAMIDQRPYKEARTIAEALEEIKKYSGKVFDPQVVDAFLKVIEIDLAENGSVSILRRKKS